jgi:Lrp/AsnC family transcriptional regulator
MPEVMEASRMAGDVDYVLRVAVADMAEYDAVYKRLIANRSMKNVTWRFAMERLKTYHSLSAPSARLPRPSRRQSRRRRIGFLSMPAA